MAAPHQHRDWQALIETLGTQIVRDGQNPALRWNEMQTRYALVDPLLGALGWDLAQPTDMRPEFQTQAGQADYALYMHGQPIVLGEAKHLRTPSLDDARCQGEDYCRASAVRYLFVTNGQRWEIYDTYQISVAPPIAQFDVTRDPAATIVQRTQWLQKAWLQYQQQPPVTIADWDPPTKSRPEKVQFPDGAEVPVPDWKALVVAIVRWLVQAHYLTSTHCPIWQTEKSAKYAVHTTPAHSTDAPFEGHATVDGPACVFHVDTKNSAPQHARILPRVITATGQDPAQFRVWFAGLPEPRG